MTDVPAIDLAGMYRDTRERLSVLVSGLSPEELDTPLAACPGWTVSDVMSHLVSVAEDVPAGKLTKPPTDDVTAEHVQRHRGESMVERLEAWEALAPPFEELIAKATIWPAVLDVAAHEQDIRGALGRPGARDTETVRSGSVQLLRWMQPPADLVIHCGEELVRVGPTAEDGADADALELETSHFEAFRWRLGRRSPAQLRAMSWSGDPAAVIDHLVVFGPAGHDVIE